MNQWYSFIEKDFFVTVPKFYSTPFLKETFAAENDHEKNFAQPQEKKYDNVVFFGPKEQKQVALTFDADMTDIMREMLLSGKVESYYDKPLIDMLVQTKTKATLFLAGMWIELYPDIAKELGTNSLFELANHSYSHPSFDGECFGLGEIPDSENDQQIEKTQDLLKNVAAVNGKVFRFPGGCYSQTDVDAVTKQGLVPIQWDVAGRDGFNDDASNIIKNVLSNTRSGSIIVLHMNGYPNEPRTLEALKEIIPELKRRGFEFVKVSELLGLHKKTEKTEELTVGDFFYNIGYN